MLCETIRQSAQELLGVDDKKALDLVKVQSRHGTIVPSQNDDFVAVGSHYPRNIAIDPTGNFMYACNHRGYAIATFGSDGGGCQVRFADQYAAVGSPAIIVFF